MGEGIYRSADEVRQVVEKFEHSEYAPEQFPHARHLATACWYLCQGSREEALVNMRTSLLRFTAHHHKQAYHETITRFWLELIGNFLDRIPEGMLLHERVNLVVEGFLDKELPFRYYSRERVLSERARREWVEPDLRPIQDGPRPEEAPVANPARFES